MPHTSKSEEYFRVGITSQKMRVKQGEKASKALSKTVVNLLKFSVGF